jgi:hypothetical protein
LLHCRTSDVAAYGTGDQLNYQTDNSAHISASSLCSPFGDIMVPFAVYQK